MTDAVELKTSKILSPQTIAKVLDYLARRPFFEVHLLIGEIMGQLKAQEDNNGPDSTGLGKDSAGRGDPRAGNSGVSPLEGKRTDYRT
jgi:hypothetical protein